MSNQPKTLLGWSCTKCTFYHHAPASRCVMCNELRESKKEMHDFILGKPIPPRQEGNFVELLDDSPEPQEKKKSQLPIQGEASNDTLPSSSAHLKNSEESSSVSSENRGRNTMTNPYAAKANPTSTANSTGRIEQDHRKQIQKPHVLAPVGQTHTNKENVEQRRESQLQQTNQKQTSNLEIIGNPNFPSSKNNLTGFRPNTQQQHQEQQQQQEQWQHYPTARYPQTQQRQKVQHQASAQHKLPDRSQSTLAKGRDLTLPCVAPTRGSQSSTTIPQGNDACSVNRQLPFGMTNSFGNSSASHVAPQSNLRRLWPQNGTKNANAPHNAQHGNVMSSPQHPQGSMEQQLRTHASVPHQETRGRKPTPANSSTRKPRNSRKSETTKPPIDTNPFSLAATRRLEYVAGPVHFREGTSNQWIYPNNKDFPIREYQVEMSETAMKYNTLVSLPTGLGKTLIAAVVMYNYYRWFPQGKVCFLAPSVPLVTQQVEACWSIMGISESDTSQMTGRCANSKRKELWRTRRVFFCTPQTLQNDIKSGTFVDASKVVCVVFDEAHKASKDYAYTKVIEQLDYACAKYRVLALSATPGTTIKKIQAVIDKLHISKIEFRADDHPSVKPYVHGRENEVILIKQCSYQDEIERDLTELIKGPIDSLRDAGVMDRIRFGGYKLGRYRIMCASEEFKKSGVQIPWKVQKNFFVAMELAGLIEQAGQSATVALRGVVEMAKKNKPHMRDLIETNEFQELLGKATTAFARAKAGPNSNSTQRNPKLDKLVEILTQHFQRSHTNGKSSRAIVFAEFRDYVSEIVSALGKQPMIRPRHFVGQGKSSEKSTDNEEGHSRLQGMKQREQQEAIREFRDGIHNTLVCTSIGEEGLDIGEVDLIVNYDMLLSPIRMIQRTGRTGRKRSGRVVSLVGEGKERQKLEKSKQAEKTLQRAMTDQRSFVMHQNIPMFEDPPTRKDTEMVIGSQFHMSQVGGHVALRGSANSREKASDHWKLTEEQQKKWRRIFGPVDELQSLDSTWPKQNAGSHAVTFRRWLLRSRSLLKSRSSIAHSTTRDVGRTVAMLKQIESSPKQNSVKAMASRRIRPTSRGGYETMHKLFPLDYVNSTETFNETRDDGEHADDDGISHVVVTTSNVRTKQSSTAPSSINCTSLPNIDTVDCGSRNDTNNTGALPTRQVQMQRSNESSKHDFSNRPSSESNVDLPVPSNSLGESRINNTSEVDRVASELSRQKDAYENTAGGCAGEIRAFETSTIPPQKTLPVEGRMPVAKVRPLDETKSGAPAFRLPTPPPSSSSSASGDDDSEHDNETLTNQAVNDQDNVLESGSTLQGQKLLIPTEGMVLEVEFATDKLLDTNVDTQPGNASDSLRPAEAPLITRLPTQDSSSSEDDDGSDENSMSPVRDAASSIRPNATHEDNVTGIEEEDEDIPLISLRTKSKERRKTIPTNHASRPDLSNLIQHGLTQNVDLKSPADGNLRIALRTNSTSSSSQSEPQRRGQIKPERGPKNASVLQGATNACSPHIDRSSKFNHASAAELSVKPLAVPTSTTIDKTGENVIQMPATQESPEPLVIRPNRKRQGYAVGDIAHSLNPSTSDTIKRQRTDGSPDNGKESALLDTPESQDRSSSTRTVDVSTKKEIDHSLSCALLSPMSLPGRAAGRNDCVILEDEDSHESPVGNHNKTLVDSSCGTVGESCECLVIDAGTDQSNSNPPRHNEKSSKVESPDVRSDRGRQQYVILDDTQGSSTKTSSRRPAMLKTPCQTNGKELVDTPVDNCDNETERDLSSLNDTPSVHGSSPPIDLNDIVCAVCLSDETDDNPIVLCDHCQTGFHQSCYSFSVDLKAEDAWFCDLCSYQQSTSEGISKEAISQCSYCCKGGGPLKRKESNGWYHPYCAHYSSLSKSNIECESCSSAHAIQCGTCTSAIHVHCAIQDKKVGVWTFARTRFENDQTRSRCAAFCPRHCENISDFVTLNAKKTGTESSVSEVTVLRTGVLSDKSGAKETKRLRKFKQGPKTGPNTGSSVVPPRDSQLQPEKDDEVKEDCATKRQRLDRRRAVMARFIDEEAKINSDDDPDGDEMEEMEARRLEDDEESDDSFIDDSLHLTQYTQDELSRVDPDAGRDNHDGVHRAVDIERERRNQFATPIFNRRVAGDTPESAPSSQRGLGNMHFIRSVLEHHKNGGDAEEIENFFHGIREDDGGLCSRGSAAAIPPRHPSRRSMNQSGRGQAEVSVGIGSFQATRAAAEIRPTSNLTAEQLQRIEANRIAALKRRKEKRP